MVPLFFTPHQWVVHWAHLKHPSKTPVFGYTIDAWCWEVPAGSLEAGQTLEEAARRELWQEVGGVAAQLESGGRV